MTCSSTRRLAYAFDKGVVVFGVFALQVSVALVGCSDGIGGGTTDNPFLGLAPVELDGQPRELSSIVTSLGPLTRKDVIRLKVEGERIDSVLILIQDEQANGTGLIVGGGPANVFFEYEIQITAEYFIFVLFDSQAPLLRRRATLTAMPGQENVTAPPKQFVSIAFDENFLTAPGLAFNDEERRVLDELSPFVHEGIVARLRTIFSGTPIEILDENDPLPDSPISRVTFLPDRVPAQEKDIFFDVVVTGIEDERPECNDPVVFGEVLPRGTIVDAGNQIPDDEAVVYVGSFQGRTPDCQSAAVSSVNNLILGLAHTAAHEIGHLVGLYHVPLIDVMNRSPTFAFQRELPLAGGQILVEGPIGYTVIPYIYQDPDPYFQGIFSR